MTKCITLHKPMASNATTVANVFIDTYMVKANGEFVKIYLYLLRWSFVPRNDISFSSIADAFNMTENDVIRALHYWEKEGLLHLVYDQDQISSIEFQELSLGKTMSMPPVQTVSAPAAAPETIIPMTTSTDTVAVPTPIIAAKPSYSMAEIQSFKTRNDGDMLFLVIQQYLGKPLSATDINTVVYFHQQLGLSVDLIEYLFEFCVSNGHKSLRYIETVARSWSEKGIATVEAAKAANETYNKTYYAVLKAFGQNRSPVKNDIQWIDKWTKEYGFSIEIVLEACHRTMAATQKPTYNYTDKILKNWKTQNLTTLEAVAQADLAFAKTKTEKKTQTTKPTNNKFHNFNQRAYDYGSLEKQLAQHKKNVDVL